MSLMDRSFKKPFQPSIVSYFGRARSQTSDSAAVSSQPSQYSAALPATIQASLLNVGMRVRKSVSEGYNIKSKTFCGNLASHSDPPFTSTHLVDHGGSIPPGFSVLLPYCGSLKAGGFYSEEEQQLAPVEEELPPLQLDYKDWSLPPTQESYVSTDTVDAPVPKATPGPNKCRREDADKEDVDLDSQPMSQRSRPISHTPMPNLNQMRPVALTRTRRKPVKLLELKESEMLDIDDLGEAGVFRPDEWSQQWM
ncbi:hypothetical protein MMC21_004873 [Puttea exsequens]|nr:hypothetical protein [Puttea exsequens]